MFCCKSVKLNKIFAYNIKLAEILDEFIYRKIE